MAHLKQDLFQLIKSLDRNEKGYVKKFTLLHSSGSAIGGSANSTNYIRLFDAIDAMEEYNEPELKKKFKGEKFSTQLHVTKNYLYNFILKSLRTYSVRSTDSLKILADMQDAEFLIGKGHYEKALECIRSARVYASGREFWGYVLELIEMERLIYNIHPLDDVLKRISQIDSERDKALTVLNTEQKYFKIAFVSRSWFIKNGLQRPAAAFNRFKKFLFEHLFPARDSVTSVNIQSLRSLYLITYFNVTDQLERSYREALNALDFLKKHSFAVRKNPRNLFNKAFNLGVAMLRMKKYEDLHRLLLEIPDYEKTYGLKLNPKLHGNIVERTAIQKIAYYINTLQFKKGSEELIPLLHTVESIKKEIPEHALNTIYFFTGNFYVLAGHPKMAIKWLNKVLIFNSSSVSGEEKRFSKYLLLIAHYELGNLEQMKSIIELFDRTDTMEPLDLLKERLPLLTSKKTEQAFWIEFKSRLLKSRNLKTILKYFDIMYWVDKKIRA